jgi:hypothetical protein
MDCGNRPDTFASVFFELLIARFENEVEGADGEHALRRRRLRMEMGKNATHGRPTMSNAGSGGGGVSVRHHVASDRSIIAKRVRDGWTEQPPTDG